MVSEPARMIRRARYALTRIQHLRKEAHWEPLIRAGNEDQFIQFPRGFSDLLLKVLVGFEVTLGLDILSYINFESLI